jgi:hypothetical protein
VIFIEPSYSLIETPSAEEVAATFANCPVRVHVFEERQKHAQHPSNAPRESMPVTDDSARITDEDVKAERLYLSRLEVRPGMTTAEVANGLRGRILRLLESKPTQYFLLSHIASDCHMGATTANRHTKWLWKEKMINAKQLPPNGRGRRFWQFWHLA